MPRPLRQPRSNAKHHNDDDAEHKEEYVGANDGDDDDDDINSDSDCGSSWDSNPLLAENQSEPSTVPQKHKNPILQIRVDRSHLGNTVNLVHDLYFCASRLRAIQFQTSTALSSSPSSWNHKCYSAPLILKRSRQDSADLYTNRKQQIQESNRDLMDICPANTNSRDDCSNDAAAVAAAATARPWTLPEWSMLLTAFQRKDLRLRIRCMVVTQQAAALMPSDLIPTFVWQFRSLQRLEIQVPITTNATTVSAATINSSRGGPGWTTAQWESLAAALWNHPTLQSVKWYIPSCESGPHSLPATVTNNTRDRSLPLPQERLRRFRFDKHPSSCTNMTVMAMVLATTVTTLNEYIQEAIPTLDGTKSKARGRHQLDEGGLLALVTQSPSLKVLTYRNVGLFRRGDDPDEDKTHQQLIDRYPFAAFTVSARRLVSVCLANNGIRPTLAVIILRALLKNRTLQKLDVSGNHIFVSSKDDMILDAAVEDQQDEAGEANKSADDAFGILLQLLRHHRASLLELHLSDCALSPQQAGAILDDCAERNHTAVLTRLHLGACPDSIHMDATHSWTEAIWNRLMNPESKVQIPYVFASLHHPIPVSLDLCAPFKHRTYDENSILLNGTTSDDDSDMAATSVRPLVCLFEIVSDVDTTACQDALSQNQCRTIRRGKLPSTISSPFSHARQEWWHAMHILRQDGAQANLFFC